MSFPSNVQLWAVPIFSPALSLGVIAVVWETFHKYKPCSPSDLGVISVVCWIQTRPQRSHQQHSPEIS